MTRRSFVTGASGFLGANLIHALLDRGDEVHAFVRPGNNSWRLQDLRDRITIQEGDITDNESVQRALARARPQEIFHLAGYGASSFERDSELTQSVNVGGTRTLYTLCQEQGGVEAIVHAGSANEYGLKHEPLREDMDAEPLSEYGTAKLRATQYGEELRITQGMPITTLRLFNAYGPFDVAVRFTAAVTLALLNSTLPKLSDPSVVRDFVYIDDVIAGLLLAPSQPFGIYNIGSGTQTSLGDMASRIKKAIGSDLELVWGGEGGRGIDSQFFMADTNKARTELGWQATNSLESGIERTVSWFRTHKSQYA